MHYANRKVLWWLSLAFFGGPCLALACIMVFVFATIRAPINICPLFLWIAANAAFASLSIHKLKQCYDETPEKWTGRWQLSLADIVSIPFFFGILMLLYDALKPQFALQIEGVPISTGIWIEYVIALLYSSRVGQAGILKKLLCSLGFAFIGAAGVFIQCGAVLWLTGYPGE